MENIVNMQQQILLIQREILAENKKQTFIMQSINQSINTFRDDFSYAMRTINENITNISDCQKEILNNQANMYDLYLTNAKENAKNQNEIKEYMKMIEEHSKVTSLFTRADFLGLNFDRNWSGNY